MRRISLQERTSVEERLKNARRRILRFRLGCAGSALATLISFLTGIYGLSVVTFIFGTIGFLGLGLGLVPYARNASQNAAFAREELREGLIERFGTEDEYVDVLPISGRIVSSDGIQTSGETFGVLRIVGLPSEILEPFVGNRRLSPEERDEIERLIGFTRRRWTFGETLALLWAVPLVALLGLFVASLRSDEPVWVVPFLVLFAGVPSYVAFAFRFEDRRLRRALERALHEDAVVEDYDEEGRRTRVLKPDGIVWTVDGTPSDLRTRWTP